MRKRLVAAVITLLLFSALFLLASYNLHMLLTRQPGMVSAQPSVVLRGLLIPQVRGLFLLGVGFSLVGIGYMLFGHSYLNYKSDMQRIAPVIETPRAEGQGQYGTAHWLEARRLPEVFDVVRIDAGADLLRELSAHGQDDLEGLVVQASCLEEENDED